MINPLQPVSLSQRAAEEVLQIMKTKNIPENYSLRLGVKGGGGCGGATLIIGFDKKKETDLHYKQGEIDMLVDKKHLMFLIGQRVDFYEGADARGFMFVDAN
jgi:iron-sulfur cluster assembly protein